MLTVFKVGVPAVLFVVTATPVAAQGLQQHLPQRQETTSARSAAIDRQARIDEHNQRINGLILENQRRLAAERKAGGEAALTYEQHRQLEVLDKRLREVIKLQESTAGTSLTREAQMKIHNERISIIMEMSKLRRELDGSTTATTLPTQAGNAEISQFTHPSLGSSRGTTLSRHEEVKAHNERIKRIIEERQRRRRLNSTQTTSTP